MKKLIIIIVGVLLIQCKMNTEKVNNKPDLLPQKVIVDNYFGHTIKDPYRFMENPSDSTVINWYKQQNHYSSSIINKISNRDILIKNLSEKIDPNSFVISKLKITSNNDYFYLKKIGDEDTAKLYFRRGYDGEENLLYDPSAFIINSKDKYSINYISPNWDGSKIAISLAKNDEEISQIVILDTSSKKLHQEIIKNCWPSALGGVRWMSDNASFTYEYLPIIDKNSENYLLNIETVLHKLDQKTSKLQSVFSKTNNPEINFKPEDFPEVKLYNQNDKYIFSNVSGASSFADYYFANSKDIKLQNINWKTLFKKEDLIKQFYVVNENLIYLTAKDASNYKICKTSLLNPNYDNPEILIPEDSTAVITDFTLTNKGIFYVKTKNGVSAKLYYFQDNKIQNIPIPVPSGYINTTSINQYKEELWIEIRGWTSEQVRYRYDHNNKNFIKENLSKKTTQSNFEDIIVEEIEISSHDGTKVPLSIIYKKGTKLDSQNNVFLYGYGAYGISKKPRLDEYIKKWIENDGVYAIAHVRGGGEKGDTWHKGGYKATKPNTWKDFIACTEYLIEKKYTSSKKIAIKSGSAGGILIGRAITERPDLYGAAIIRVGNLNPLRSEFAPNGKNNTKEFGSINDSIGFKSLLAMDSYHHIKNNVEYPAVYLTTGMNDARVVHWMTGKFAAKLQRANKSNNPILLSVDFEGGHGFDASTKKKNEELADILSFAFWQTGHPDYQLRK